MPEAEPVLYHGSFTIGEGYARRAANDFMRWQLRRPIVWMQIALPLISIPVISTAFDRYPFSFPIALGVDLVLIVANTLSWVTKRQNLTTRLNIASAVGASRELSMTESTISLRTDDSLGQSPYRHYESAETHGDFVFLRLRGSSMRSIVPRELFTDESLAFLRSKLV